MASADNDPTRLLRETDVFPRMRIDFTDEALLDGHKTNESAVRRTVFVSAQVD